MTAGRMPLSIVIDGLIFQKDPHGGIARLFQETLPRICDLDDQARIVVFLDGPVKAGLPEHEHIQVRRALAVHRTLRPRGLARRMLYPLRRAAGTVWNRVRGGWLAGEQDNIWHSTYYTLPPHGWRGPQVLTLYDLIHERYPDLFSDPLDEIGRQNKRHCVMAAKKVICISETTRQEAMVRYGLKDEEAVIVPIAYSRVFRRLEHDPYTPLDVEAPYLLYVGGRAHYKNFSTLLEVYRQWPGRERVELRVVGAPVTTEEGNLLRQLGLENRIRFMGRVNDTELCLLYNRAEAFVYPSLYEGFGIPSLEALACGCPVIASDIPASREVAGEWAAFFDPCDPAALVSALETAVANGRSSPRVAGGLEWVKQFTWERTAAGMLDVYRQVMA